MLSGGVPTMTKEEKSEQLQKLGTSMVEGTARIGEIGVRKLAQEGSEILTDQLQQTADVFTQTIQKPDGSDIEVIVPLNEVPQLEDASDIENFAGSIVQFMLGMAVAPGGMYTKGATSAFMFDENEGDIAGMLNDAGMLPSFLEFLTSDAEERDAEGRMRQRLLNVVQEGALAGSIDLVVRAAKQLKRTPDALDRFATAVSNKFIAAGDRADARIAERAADTSVTLGSGVDPTPAIDAALSYAGRKARKSGQLVGAPPEITSQRALNKLRRNLEAAAVEGEPGRFWYERSGRAILDALGGDKAQAEKLAQAIGITSNATGVAGNFDFALQAFLQHKAGQPIKTGRFPASMSKRLQDVFDGKDWEGRKTNNFYINLMREIDPSRVQGVTTDMWMMRAFGFKNADGTPYTGTPTDAQYTFVEEETKRIATRLGWEPQQVQAAIWVANKAKSEGTDISAAAFDYSDALLNNKAQISWESIPGATGKHLPEMFDAPYEVQQEYHVAVSKAFLDQDGNDLLAKELGVPTPGDFEAPGYFEGKVSPGTQTELAIPRKYGGAKYGEIEPAAMQLMEAYAAVRGVVMKQDGVGYHRPFYKASKKDSQGVLVDIGRQFTERETAQLAEIMAELSGHTDYNPIAAPGGVRLINFAFARKNEDGTKAMADTWFSDDMLKTNKEFHILVEQAVERLDLDDNVGVKVGTFNAQEGYVGNDWSVNKNGEDYIKGTSFEGSPDLQRKVRDLISLFSERVDEIDIDFAERYGFTRNTELNASYRQDTQANIDTGEPPDVKESDLAKEIAEKFARLRKPLEQSPMQKSWSEESKTDLEKSLYDRRFVNERAMTATLAAIEKEAKNRNLDIHHISKNDNGETTSIYINNPDGKRIRISDHELPDTSEREYKREQGIGFYNEEIILDSAEFSWEDTSLEQYIDFIINIPEE